MTDKKRIQVLRREIDSYMRRLDTAEKENKRLSNNLIKADETEEKRSFFHENATQEYKKLKKEYNDCIDELYDYKKKYLDLLEDMDKLKQYYQKEFKTLMKAINKNARR